MPTGAINVVGLPTSPVIVITLSVTGTFLAMLIVVKTLITTTPTSSGIPISGTTCFVTS